MSDHVRTFTDANFETEVLKSSIPVVVDFWASWCGPCKQIAPYLEAIAAEYAAEASPKAVIGKLSVEENEVTPANYKVRGIPFIAVFKNGEKTAEQVGALSKEKLKAFIDAAVAA